MFHDLAHVPAFAGGAALAFAHLRQGDPPLRRAVAIIVWCALVGLAIELGQLATGTGAFQLSDLAFDALGVAIGLAVAAAGLRVWRRWIVDVIVVVGVVAGLLMIPDRAGVPAFEYASAAVEQRCTGGARPAPVERPAAARPIARYPLDEAAGRTVHDEIGGLDLTIGNPAVVSWAADGGLDFGGEEPHVASDEPAAELTAAVDATDEVSVEVWFTPAVLPQTGPARIVSHSGGTDFGDTNVHVGIEGHAVSFRVRTDCDHFNSTFGDPTLTAGRTTHVVATYRPGRAAIYVDGVEAGAAALQFGLLDSWDPGLRLHLADEATGDRPYVGTIHEVAIYDRALLPDEVARRYQLRR